jgi:hypothetical protein
MSNQYLSVRKEGMKSPEKSLSTPLFHRQVQVVYALSPPHSVRPLASGRQSYAIVKERMTKNRMASCILVSEQK